MSFYSEQRVGFLKIYQPKEGFRYNSDSLLLYDFALSCGVKGDILDIGCGSGVVGLLLARDLGSSLTGIDKQDEMVRCSLKSAELNGVEAEFICIEAAEFKSEKRFGLIVSNPPFYPSGGTRSANPSKDIARYAEHLPFDLLVEKANAHLHNRGSFVFCYDARAIQQVMTGLSEKKFYVSTLRFVHPSQDKEARLVLVEANKYQKGTPRILPPVLMDDEDYLQSVRDKAKTESII